MGYLKHDYMSIKPIHLMLFFNLYHISLNMWALFNTFHNNLFRTFSERKQRELNVIFVMKCFEFVCSLEEAKAIDGRALCFVNGYIF